MEEKRLFLLDAYALIYRAYYALIRAPRVTSKGFNTSAIFGFCNTLEDILRKENPTHIAVCFDPPGGQTFRHEEYPQYKAQRDKQPEDITAAIPYIKRILEAYRIPAVEVPGYEADDVIGTLSRMAESDGFTTYMMTPDKDYCQLVTDKVLMYRPALKGDGFEVRGPQQVSERYGIESPRQMIDLLALEGDASDNVPGCPGVGEKTAVKLIAEYGSVENLIEHADSLKGAIQLKIKNNVEQIRLSKYLVTIKTDVPLDDLTPESLVRRDADMERLLEVYRELEFRSFINKLTGSSSMAEATAPVAEKNRQQGVMGSLFDLPDPTETAAVPTLTSLASTPHNYRKLSDHAEIEALIARACRLECVGISVDADGTEDMIAVTRGIAIATGDGEAYYVEGADAGNFVAPLIGSDATIAGDEIKRAYLLMKRCGAKWTAPYFDTSVAHYLLDPEAKHTLRVPAMKYLDYEISAPETVSRAEAACEKADIARRLMPILNKEIETDRQSKLLHEVELPLIRVLAEMEWTGVRIDTKELAELSMRYTARLNDMETQAYQLAGEKFNVSSPMQVGEILFGKLGIDPNAKRTKRGAYSTTEEILEKYRNDYEIVDLILRIRALRKLLTTYINALPALVNQHTHKIHTSYNQTVTATGRISSTNPNLQNIPIRSADGREIRRAFIADEGDILLSADYSQIELRLMAMMSGDSNMIEAFHEGSDIHRATAAKIYHERLEDVSDEQRRSAKTANFGIIYGISAFGLSERLGISRAEAKSLIEGYFRTYPGVQRYMEQSIADARERGYVTTLLERKRYLPDIHSRSAVIRSYAERNAINAPLQGSAADIIKVAMVNIFDEMQRRQMRSRMIMQVHDELVFNVVPEELEAVSELVVRCMECAYTGSVRLEVGVGTGKNWLEAH